MKFNYLIFALAVFFTVLSVSLAENKLTSATGSWFDPTIWVSSGVPTSSDDVTIAAQADIVAADPTTARSMNTEGPSKATFQSSSSFSNTVSINKDVVVTFQDSVTTALISITNGTMVNSGNKKPTITGQINNSYLHNISNTSPTFESLFQIFEFGQLNITGDGNQNTIFNNFFIGEGGSLYSHGSDLTFKNYLQLKDNFVLQLESSKDSKLSKSLVSNSTVDFSDSKSTLTSVNDIFYFKTSTDTTKVYIHEDSSIQGSNLNLLFNNTSLYLLDTSNIKTKNDSFIYIENGELVAKDQTYLDLDNTDLWLQGSNFIGMGQSKFNFSNQSRLYIKGTLNFLEDGMINVDKSQILIDGKLFLHDQSVLSISDSDIPSFLNGDFALLNTTKAIINNNDFNVIGRLFLQSMSRLEVSDSFLNIPGKVYSQDANYISITNSKVEVYGAFFAPKIDIKKSQLLVDGEFSISNDALFESSTINVLYGNLTVKSNSFIANNCNITVEKSIKFASSKFLTSDTNITILNGELNIERGGVIQLNNTNFYNSKGLLDTGADIQIVAGSSFVNTGSIVLSSHILKNEDANQIVLNNFGNFSVGMDRSRINIPVSNSGSFKILSNTVSVGGYTQSQGTFSIQGGLLNSNSTIVINGGTIQGRGTFNQSIINNGILGDRDGNVHNFKINGDYQQTGAMIINILTLEDFTKINVTNIAKIQSTIEVRISSDALSKLSGTENGTQVDLISFNQGSEFNMDSIKFSTFNPATPTEDKQTTDTCVAQAKLTGTSFSVLLKGCPPKKPLLSAGAIAGIIVGGAVAVIATTIVVANRKSIAMAFKVKKADMKLKTANKNNANKPKRKRKPRIDRVTGKPKEPTPFQTPPSAPSTETSPSIPVIKEDPTP
ncbi:hypothetical protein CYY_000104 [Polysphondylium violaceum]|uniref:Peptidase A2 domain-containing protein n=1 Tax=Polysphondylium violaceum TaxID=133409 RepID=A0A8J4Q4D0_9MYCE|nr:hypothetical protein CYY_000104 [Polysphondylium violaceum]